jgi:hypothetical protein
MAGQSGSSTSTAQVTVLIGEGQAVPDRFLANLRRRGGDPQVVRSAPEAMLALHRQRAHVLIIVEPQSVRRLDALLDAVRQSFPGVTCWRFDPTRPAAARLSRFDPAEAQRPTPVSPEPHAPVGNPGAWDQRAGVSPTATGAASVVTAEELAMLMGPLEYAADSQAHAGDDRP